jgi:hypothetical protein
MTEIVDVSGSERRRNWGLVLLAGGGMAMTGFAAGALWLVRGNAAYAFYLGLSAMALIGIVLTGFAGLLIKRTIRIGRDGFEVSDQGGGQG